MDWSELTERIARLAEEIQKTVAAIEDYRKELASIEEELIISEKLLALIASDKDVILRHQLEQEFKKPTEKMLDRALLKDASYRAKYIEVQDYRAKKAALECTIKALEQRLKGLSLLIKLAEMDVSYFNKFGIIEKHTKNFDELDKINV